eukprot:gene17922-36605_t
MPPLIRARRARRIHRGWKLLALALLLHALPPTGWPLLDAAPWVGQARADDDGDDGDDSDDELDAYGERSAREAPVQEDGGRAWVFTSATLGDDARLSWFTEPCGLGEARVLRVDSPFDYARQAAVYVPLELPKPNDARHSEEVAALV